MVCHKKRWRAIKKTIRFKLTVLDAHEAVVHQLESGGTRAGDLWTPAVDLRCRQAQVRAVSVHGLTVVGAVRLAVRMVHVDRHRVLELLVLRKKRLTLMS